MRIKDLIKQTGGSVTNLFNVPVDMLDCNPGNIRLDRQELRDHIRALADDMKANGFDRTRPLTIRIVNDRAEVQDGNCRLAAVRLAIAEGAQIVNLPCVPETEGLTEEERLARMATRNTSLPHSAAEYAVIIKKFRSWGWTDSAIAARLQKSRQFLINCMDFADAPAEVREAVAAGTVSQTEAVKLVRTVGAEGAGAAIARAVLETGKARVTAKHVRAAAFTVPREPVRTSAEATPPATSAAPVSGSCEAMAEAVRAFLAAWDKDTGGAADQKHLIACVETLRGMV